MTFTSANHKALHQLQHKSRSFNRGPNISPTFHNHRHSDESQEKCPAPVRIATGWGKSSRIHQECLLAPIPRTLLDEPASPSVPLLSVNSVSAFVPSFGLFLAYISQNHRCLLFTPKDPTNTSIHFIRVFSEDSLLKNCGSRKVIKHGAHCKLTGGKQHES